MVGAQRLEAHAMAFEGDRDWLDHGAEIYVTPTGAVTTVRL
jgi:hypothetical protein